MAREYDAYTTVDLGASHDVNERVTLNGAVYNLFDKKIREGEFGTVREGRSLWLGATARF